jgi:hypothetical protein
MKASKVQQKHLFNVLLASSMLCISILACSIARPESSQNPKPTHYGVFYEKDGELIELQEQEIFDTPVEKQMGNIQTISDSQPSFIIWRSNTNLDYLEFLKLNQYLGESKQNVNYNAAPKDNGIIEIVPKSSLENGVYCLIQGDPLAATLSGWCFKLGSTAQIQPLPTSTIIENPTVQAQLLPTSTTSEVPTAVTTTDYSSECFLYAQSHEWDKAIECDKNWTLAEPENYYAWRDLGNAYSNAGNSQESVDAIIHSLSLAKSSEEKREAYLGIGVGYYYLSDFDNAVSYLEQGASIVDNAHPGFRAEILVWLSRSYEANAQPEKACESWKQTLEFVNSTNNQYWLDTARDSAARCP